MVKRILVITFVLFLFFSDLSGRVRVKDLPEFVVESSKNRILHLLAFQREFSTLTTYTDTVFLFREKMVDYMVPNSKVSKKFKGWLSPRPIVSKSYYRFTNSLGLDSVSDECNYHFSWGDWIGCPPISRLTSNLVDKKITSDTIRGKYSPVEIWNRNQDTVNVEINIMADSSSRKWVPGFTRFFQKDIDFDIFKIKYLYDNITGNYLQPSDLTCYSFEIESTGRGHKMFRFNRPDESVFIRTESEVYVLDKEFISLKEAKKWENLTFDSEEIGIFEPAGIPPLSSSVLNLISRVEKVDKDGIRLEKEPDQRYVAKYDGSKNFQLGRRMLFMLKQLTGITLIKSRKNMKKKWQDFKEEWKQSRNSDTRIIKNRTDTVFDSNAGSY